MVHDGISCNNKIVDCTCELSDHQFLFMIHYGIGCLVCLTACDATQQEAMPNQSTRASF